MSFLPHTSPKWEASAGDLAARITRYSGSGGDFGVTSGVTGWREVLTSGRAGRVP